MNNIEQLTKRDREILDHYQQFLGQPSRLYDYEILAPQFHGPLFVVEFAAATPQDDWRYLTLGMSRRSMPTAPIPYHRIELLMYTSARCTGLSDVLAGLASYPFLNETHLAVGHTIAGELGEGVVPGSPLTDFILTPVYFEPDGFSFWRVSDGTHIEVLWATPIYLSERLYVRQNGWRALVEGPFIEHEVEPTNFWRDPVV